MATTKNDLSYKNIISQFFVGEKMVVNRDDRIENGFQFVLKNVPVQDLSEKLQDVIRKKVASVEITFFKRFRESYCKSKEEFEQHYDKWVQMDLKVRTIFCTDSIRILFVHKRFQFCNSLHVHINRLRSFLA